MRYFLAAMCLCVSIFSKAQFTFNANAGANYSYVHITSSQAQDNSFRGGLGWQFGAGTEYNTRFGYFLYIGANLAQRSYKRDSAYYTDTVYTYKYRPLFLNIPFGIGFQKPLDDKLNLKFYMGVNTQVGLAGKIQRDKTYYGNVFTDPDYKGGLITEADPKTAIKYGDKGTKKPTKPSAYNFAVSNWGINPAIGIDFMHSAELKLSYSYGFTNFLPGKKLSTEIYKLRVVELNLKVNYPNPYYQKKHNMLPSK